MNIIGVAPEKDIVTGFLTDRQTFEFSMRIPIGRSSVIKDFQKDIIEQITEISLKLFVLMVCIEMYGILTGNEQLFLLGSYGSILTFISTIILILNDIMNLTKILFPICSKLPGANKETLCYIKRLKSI